MLLTGRIHGDKPRGSELSTHLEARSRASPNQDDMLICQLQEVFDVQSALRPT